MAEGQEQRGNTVGVAETRSIHCVDEAGEGSLQTLMPAFKFQLYHLQGDFRDFFRCLSVQRIKLFPPEE